MAKKHSTGALSEERKNIQNDRYKEGHKYDYLIVGTGSAALTVGALLANAGYKICMLEAHDIPGGYLQNFEMGGYTFCSQVHYIWGCAPGGRIYEFLKHIGLEEDITFELFDPEGYDHAVLPDGHRIKIPYGYEKLVENIAELYPDQREKVTAFCDFLTTLKSEMAYLPESQNVGLWSLFNGFKMMNIIRYRNATLQDIFNKFGLSKEAQLILCADAGDFMLPPNQLSIFMYIGLFGGYNTGTYYPTKHFKYYVDRLIQFITGHEGCHVYYETQVTEIHSDGDYITGVTTQDGKQFTAEKVICNMDPQTAAHMIGWEKFSNKEQKQLSYEYSESGVVIYLGLKDIDLRKYGFGSYNIWHMEGWDMNQMWQEMGEGNFDNPWVFLSTATLHTDQPGVTPGPNDHILELASFTKYHPFKEAQDRSYTEYRQRKTAISDRMMQILEEKYIPDIKNHIEVKVVGTNVTSEDFNMAPMGNAYGSSMTPGNVNLNRLKAHTPFKNLWWCNASSGFAGVYGTVLTGINLYMDLTGDRFYDHKTAPTDDQMLKDLYERIKSAAT